MPTDKQRVSVVIDDELYQQLEEYRYTNRIPSLSKAVSQLVGLGIMCKDEPSYTEETENITVTFDKPLLRDILEYQKTNNVDSFSRSVRMLVQFGLVGEEVNRGNLTDPYQHALKRNELLLLAEYLAGASTTEKQEYILYLIRTYKKFANLDTSVDQLVSRQKESIEQMRADESTSANEA